MNTPIGTPVHFKDALSEFDAVTRSMPWQIGNGEWVVALEGHTGGYGLSFLTLLGDVASYLDENPDLVLIGLWNIVPHDDADPTTCQIQAVFTSPVDITESPESPNYQAGGE